MLCVLNVLKFVEKSELDYDCEKSYILTRIPTTVNGVFGNIHLYGALQSLHATIVIFASFVAL